MNENDDRSGDAAGQAPVPPNSGPALELAPEDYPDVSHLITEDGAPVDGIYVEKQYQLLKDPLQSSWAGPGEGCSFVALTNVGLFAVPKNPALVPDFLLSLDVEYPRELLKKEHHSYYIWLFGKPPDVVLEIVSDRRGGEDSHKMRQYARLRVQYYVIYDPNDLLGGGELRVLELRGRDYAPVADNWLSDVGLGLKFWEGDFAGAREQWLRWCDREGNLLLTGRERAEQAEQLAQQERQRAEEQAERVRQLEAQLRAAGIEPSTEPSRRAKRKGRPGRGRS